jgi:hypothetical protein
LQFKIDPVTGASVIDWQHSQAIYLQVNNVYLSPTGLADVYRENTGPELKKLKRRVFDLLSELKDQDGQSPFSSILPREDAKSLGLPSTDRVGDLILAFTAGYGGNERTTKDMQVFNTSFKGGYKQGVQPQHEMGMWTPFIIVGPKIKKAYQLAEPIRHQDQYPTLMRLLQVEVPAFVQGHVIDEVIAHE